jgi:FAD/FMN-containing dehydrogenase/Fe-S oxidoreductase
MDAERERIQADLRGLVAGEVRCDDLMTQLYASDASLYEIRPLGVVRPRDTADVVATVRYAAERGIPLHARGAGTGIAGESIGPGLVVDFAHSMKRILAVSQGQARIQPGVVHAQLNRHLAASGRHFGPDPATTSVTTMGSVLALDNSGSHWLRYGSARRHVESLQVVLASGDVLNVSQHDLSGTSPLPGPLDAIVTRIAELIRREAATLENCRPKALVNRSGYHLYDVLANGRLDLARLLVGSEGTLGLITEATVRTDPLPRHVLVELLFFERLELAAKAAMEAGRMGVSACDLMDRRLLSIARETDARYHSVIPPESEAMLLIEDQGDDARTVRDRLAGVVHKLVRQEKLAFASRAATLPEETEFYWRLANKVVPRLYTLKGASRAIPFMEDFAVPPESLPEFCTRLLNVLKQHAITATLFGHAGHGQLHVRPFLDLSNPDDVRRLQATAEDVYEEVLRVGGTISGEHGDGLSRTWFGRRQHGPLYSVFREVKSIFDPRNLLNPGKVVAENPQRVTENLRGTAGAAFIAAPPLAGSAQLAPLENARERIELHLLWQSDPVPQIVNTCNGCGQCRTQLNDTRMCPIFRFVPSEEATPRAKANLLRAVLTGALPVAAMKDDEFKAIADLCVNCHQCRLECPANVDIPKLMIEAKSQYVAANGLQPGDWFITRLERWAAWGSLFSGLTNWALGNRQMRWMLERITGLAQGRKVPHVASRSFLRLAHRRRWDRPVRRAERKVVYFADVYANWFDVSLGEAAVRCLEHNGVAVYVHPEQLPSGMARLSHGDVDRARRIARVNIALLAEAVRQGYQVVTSEPSASLCLTHEYPHLVADDDARLVAQSTSDVCAYLLRMHQAGKLELDFQPINAQIGYHLPCHIRAQYAESPGEQLLRLIPGLTVQRLERGCSGMAGIFGLKRANYRRSLRMGRGLISAMREPTIEVGSTECSSCKIQMEQGTTKPTVHPLKLLALAYGLMPEFKSLLTRRSQDLIVT